MRSTSLPAAPVDPAAFARSGLDNAMIESFRSSMQIELLNRKRWHTRVELANAMFDYIEIFHNRQRRHPQLGYLSPAQFELTAPLPQFPA